MLQWKNVKFRVIPIWGEEALCDQPWLTNLRLFFCCGAPASQSLGWEVAKMLSALQAFFAAWAMLCCQCNRASSVLVELFHQRGELDAKVWFIFFSHCFAVFVDFWALPQTCLPRFSFMFVLGLLTNLLILVNGGKADFSSLASCDLPLPDHCNGWKPTETKIGEK